MTQSGRAGSNLLTYTQVLKALKAGVPCKLQDGGSLVLHVTGKNKGRWLYRGRLPKDPKRRLFDCVCGHENTALSEVRAERDRCRALLKQGINPNEQKREEAEKARQEEAARKLTFARVTEELLSKQEREGISPKSIQSDRGRLKNHMGPLQDVPVTEIRRAVHLKPLIDALVNKGQIALADKVAGLAQRVLGYAVDCGYIETSPADRLSRLIPRQDGAGRHHAATVKEPDARRMLTQLFACLAERKNTVAVSGALRILCYAPLRIGDLIAAKWEHVDLDKGTWLLPETKNGKDYTMPITRQIREQLDWLAEYRGGSPYVFPGIGKKNKHVSDNALRKVLRTAGITQAEQSLHGFRSTFQSLSLEAGIPKALTERLLFHTAGNAVEQAYNRTDYATPIRLALAWWDDAVDAMATGQPLPPVPAEFKPYN